MALSDVVVVMDAGRIEQSGPPRVVYNEPATHFVARFIGGHNVVGGEVASREGGCTTLSGPEGARLLVAGDPGGEGTPVRFAVRSDRVTLSADAPAEQDLCALPAEIRSIEYHGAWVAVSLESAVGEELSALLPEGAYFASPFEIGDRVVVSWSVEDSHVLGSTARAPSQA